MQTKLIIAVALISVVLYFVAISCKTSSPTEEVYIPLITNAWSNEADPQHRFLFQSEDEGKSSGTFTGEEIHPILYPDSNPQLSGAFKNRNIEFTTQRPTGAVKFRGKFVVDTLIDFGSMRLVRPKSQ